MLATAVLVLALSPVQQIDFDTEVVPILTRAGCNGAACHGSAAGRGGLKLSLFGADAAADYDALVRQREGRRINFVHPEQSLLLAKPTGLYEHEGGVRLDLNADEGRKLLAWIQQGAQRAELRQLTNLEVRPQRLVLDQLPANLTLHIKATFADRAGTEHSENVTTLAIISSNDPEAIHIGQEGAVAVLRGGRHTVNIRFLDRMATVTFTAPWRHQQHDDLVDRLLQRAEQAENLIDQHVYGTLAELELPASDAAGDATLLRRLTLALTGRLPSQTDVLSYQDSADPQKYRLVVDRLLDSPQFAEYWTHLLARQLRLRAVGNDVQALTAIHQWLHVQVSRDLGWQVIARQLILAEGDSHALGPATFYRLAGDARGQAEYVSEALLGVRLRCANCHNHPLDRWTQDDYHGLAAIFARLDTGPVVRLKSSGQVIHPATGQPARPRLPGVRWLDAQQDGRVALADWMMEADNPYFARAMVNRVWKHLLGRGLVEPVDDLRDTNPATHPELLAQLETHFREHGYRLRPLIRQIVLSDVFRRGPATADNEIDDRFYSHFRPQPLAAEVLADAINDVTGVSDQYGEQPLGTRAISLIDPATPSRALDVLGRCNRASGCETSSGDGSGLAMRLHLLNGALLNGKLAAEDNVLAQLIAHHASNAEIVQQLYLRSLARLPDARELEHWMTQLADLQDAARREMLEDLLWGLLNCQEFVTNH